METGIDTLDDETLLRIIDLVSSDVRNLRHLARTNTRFNRLVKLYLYRADHFGSQSYDVMKYILDASLIENDFQPFASFMKTSLHNRQIGKQFLLEELQRVTSFVTRCQQSTLDPHFTIGPISPEYTKRPEALYLQYDFTLKTDLTLNDIPICRCPLQHGRPRLSQHTPECRTQSKLLMKKVIGLERSFKKFIDCLNSTEFFETDLLPNFSVFHPITISLLVNHPYTY